MQEERNDLKIELLKGKQKLKMWKILNLSIVEEMRNTVQERTQSLLKAEQFSRRDQSCSVLTLKVLHLEFQCHALQLPQMQLQKPWCSLCFIQQRSGGWGVGAG